MFLCPCTNFGGSCGNGCSGHCSSRPQAALRYRTGPDARPQVPEQGATSLDLLLAKKKKKILTCCGVVHGQNIPRPRGQSWSLGGFPLWTCSKRNYSVGRQDWLLCCPLEDGAVFVSAGVSPAAGASVLTGTTASCWAQALMWLEGDEKRPERYLPAGLYVVGGDNIHHKKGGCLSVSQGPCSQHN